MRVTSIMSLLLIVTDLTGQWSTLPVEHAGSLHSLWNVPQMRMTMAAADTGYSVGSTYISPASGSILHVYMTGDEWENSAEVHELFPPWGGCCLPWRIAARKDGGALIAYFSNGNIRFMTIGCQAGVCPTTQHASGVGFDSPFTHAEDSVFFAVTKVFAVSTAVRFGNTTAAWSGMLTNDDSDCIRIDFHNANVGAALSVDTLGGRTIRMTVDGGNNWSPIWEDAAGQTCLVHWSSDSCLWIGGLDGLLATSCDRGATWETVVSPIQGDVLAFDSYSTDSLWIASGSGQVATSGDRGQTWTDLPVLDSSVMYLQILRDVVYAYTADGRIHRWGAVDTDPPYAGESSFWATHAFGFRMLLAENESLMDVRFFDSIGRVVRPMFTNSDVLMQGCRDGVYVVQALTNYRTVTQKLVWASPE